MVYAIEDATPPASNVAGIIDRSANRYGIPAWIPLDIAKVESSLNPYTIGDNGTSIGLFQLHRGGLAPSNLSNSQLMDPATNSDIAISAMSPAVKRGQSLGLSGQSLLEYTAFTSGWPGNFGSIANGERRRPDYAAALARAYNGDLSVSTAAENASVNAAYTDNAYHSTVAETFRQFSDNERVEPYQSWQKNLSFTDKINPFKSNALAYLWDQRTPYGIRALFVLIGLVFVIVGIVGLVLKTENEVVAPPGPAPADGSSGSVGGEVAL